MAVFNWSRSPGPAEVKNLDTKPVWGCTLEVVAPWLGGSGGDHCLAPGKGFGTLARSRFFRQTGSALPTGPRKAELLETTTPTLCRRENRLRCHAVPKSAPSASIVSATYLLVRRAGGNRAGSLCTFPRSPTVRTISAPDWRRFTGASGSRPWSIFASCGRRAGGCPTRWTPHGLTAGRLAKSSPNCANRG